MAKIKEIPTKAHTLSIRRAEFPGPTRLKWEKLKTFNEFAYKKGLVKGYYTLSNAGIEKEELSEMLRKKLPSSYLSLHVTLLSRLAVSKSYQGEGLGEIYSWVKPPYDIADKIPTDKDRSSIYFVGFPTALIGKNFNLYLL